MNYSSLASGSRANSAIVEHDKRLILIDAGLGPVSIKKRLATLGFTVEDIECVILTHTHCDHYNPATIKRLQSVWCHRDHPVDHPNIKRYSGPFCPMPGLKITPIPLYHDSVATHGFRFDTDGDSIAHLADTGIWTRRIADAVTDVRVLAVEANHDVTLQRSSDRPQSLIDRNLGVLGHLSNDQCRGLVEASGSHDHIILLHLSSLCNTPETAMSAVPGSIVAMQDAATPLI